MKSDVTHEVKYRVMYVSAVADFKGGAEKCLQQFMQNPSVDPVLVVPALGELSFYAEKRSIPVYVIDYGMVNSIRRPFKFRDIIYAGVDAVKAAWSIKRLAKKLNVDCIHSNGLKPHGMLVLGRFFGRVPVVCHIHDIPYTFKEKLFWRLLALSFYRVLLVSKHCWVSDNLPMNVLVVPNGIEVSNQHISDKQIFLNKSSKPLKLGFIGRIHPYKGLHLAIEWLEAARKGGINCELYVRGEAASSEAQYLSVIKRTIEEKSLTDFCFFEGKVSGLDKVYANIDITLMPSVVAEPFGLVAIESFDQGLPKNSDEFVFSLKKLLSSDQQFNAIRSNAHKRLKELYSEDRVYELLDSNYNDFLQS
jgi:glycosyltransferase involved in cell wall biosynthesis